MFDPQTLIAVVVLLALILGLCMLGLRQTLPPGIAGLYPWSFALFGFAGASGLAYLAGQGRIDTMWLLLAGLLYVVSAIAMVVSMRRFTGRITPWWALLAAVALAALPAPSAWLLQWPSGWAAPWLLTVMLLCCLFSLEALWHAPAARRSLGGRLLLFALASMVVSTGVRLGAALFGDAPSAWMQAQTTLRSQIALIYASAALLIGSIGLILMATDRLRRMLEHLASHDALTGLLERNGFRGPAEHSLALARRREEPVACLLCDIDLFKQVNDRHGHPAGDAGLVMVAGLLRDSARVSDLVSRFGGEEFALLLPNCDEAAAQRFAERLRLAVEASPLVYRGEQIPLTISIGVAVARGSQLQLEPLYRRADRALYLAKRSGRNRVRMAGSESPRSAAGAQNTQENSKVIPL